MQEFGFSMYIENRVPDIHSAEGWKTVKSKFLTYFNPIGSTKEQQIKAWKELKWKPEEEKLPDFVFRFSQLAHELGYTDEQQISHFVLCIPRGLYLYLEGAQTVPDAVENLRKGIALGGLDTFGAIARPVKDDGKPTVPFMIERYLKPVAFGTINYLYLYRDAFPASYAISWLECFTIM